MSNAVIPRILGDDYQAKIFWLRACDLFIGSTNVSKVVWEADTTFGFDDVVVHYNPAKLDNGQSIHEECFQIKFHVNQTRGFSWEALMDPGFIGATEESLLQRLYKLYKRDPERAKKSRFLIINTWGVEKGNPIGDLLDNSGAIRLQQLYTGKTANSIMGNIRKQWREHLKINDDELREVLMPLRIEHSYGSLERLKENLNRSFELVGFKPLRADQRSNPYTDLIQKLHAEKRTIFTKEELLSIVQSEGLIAEKEILAENIFKVGIRTFKKGAENLEVETDKLLCLLKYFSDRFINEEYSWENEIFPEVQTLASDIIQQPLPTLLYLDTHLSTAFSLGYCIGNKTGKSISLVQKIPGGKIIWKPELEKLSRTENVLSWTDETINPKGSEVALVLSITHDIGQNVKEYITSNIPAVSKMNHATINPGPSHSAIRDANHIILMVEEIVSRLRTSRTSLEKQSNLHIFLACPGAVAFTLGQYASPLGRIVLYEYDFENRKTGSYTEILHLPINQTV